MELTYKDNKLKNLCEDPSYNKDIVKKYGSEIAKKLPRRINELKSFNTLNDVPTNLPFRRHKLDGNRNGCFAVCINNQYRIIFIPLNKNNKEIENLKNIIKIEIMEVSKHYE